MMGASTSCRWEELQENACLQRFVSTEVLSAEDPFWNKLVSTGVVKPRTKSDWRVLEDNTVGQLCRRLAANNVKTGNLAALVDVFLARISEDVSDSGVIFVWQSLNALFIIRMCAKGLLQCLDGDEEALIQHLGGRPRVEELCLALGTVLCKTPESHTYELQLECATTFVVLMSSPIHGHRSSMAEELVHGQEALATALVRHFIAQLPRPPTDSGGGSLVMSLASGVWNLLTLGYSSVAATTTEANLESCHPLADMSLILLLVLANHSSSSSSGSIEEPNNPWRKTLFTWSDDFAALFSTLSSSVSGDEATLLLYLMLHHNTEFRTHVLASSDVDLLVVPILKTLYHANERNNHHVYMSLIVLLILSEDDLFNASVHDNMIKGIDWYGERILGEISLGGLLILVVIRTIQHNMLKMRDKYLHTNCLAALANMSSQFKNLHPYVSQRIVSMFEALAKKYFRLVAALNDADPGDNNDDKSNMADALADAAVLEEVIRMVLEIINSALVAQIKNNSNLIYTILYKKEVFEPFFANSSFQDLSQNVQTVITFFNGKLEQVQEREGPLGVQQVQDFIRQTALQFPKEKLKKFPDLKFKYVEEDKPEDFFIPYVWSLARQKIYWNPKNIKLSVVTDDDCKCR